jgi:hypothetical protein
MKKLLLIALLFITASSFGQSAKAVFESDKMVWFGLDFTNAKMIGMSDESPSTIKDVYFRAWNGVILDQPEKFKLDRFFRKESVIKDVEQVGKRNSKVDPDQLASYNEKEITNDMVNEIIKGFNTGNIKEGVGLIFIVESFNKSAREAVFHVAFFDIVSKKVLLTKRVTGLPSGFGLRNYWGNAVYSALQRIDRGLYKEWKDESMKLKAN